MFDLNRKAAAQLSCPNSLIVVKGATHLFEEPGTLGEVASLAKAGFVEHLLTVEATPMPEGAR